MSISDKTRKQWQECVREAVKDSQSSCPSAMSECLININLWLSHLELCYANFQYAEDLHLTRELTKEQQIAKVTIDLVREITS